jgi:hypothetical protein
LLSLAFFPPKAGFNCRSRVYSDEFPFLSEVRRDIEFVLLNASPGLPAEGNNMHFDIETIDLPRLFDESPAFDIQPIHGSKKSEWMVLKGSGELVIVDFGDRSIRSVGNVNDLAFNRAQEAMLRVSDDGRFAAVANRRSVKGAVIDLSTGRTTMSIYREDYYAEHCPFPLAFVQKDSKSLLIHATQWNRLDLSDPETGELLTVRPSPKLEAGKGRPEHYLDYFHATLLPSPDGRWIADNGWAWHPVGIVRTWSVERWLNENVWESEDGPTTKNLCGQDNWDQPMCWIDSRTLAAWGEDTTSENDRSVFGLFDVESGVRKRIFNVPVGPTFVDNGRLFVSKSPWTGIHVWDVASGEALLHDSHVRAVKYHRGMKQFWGFGTGLTHVLSRLDDAG